MTKLNELSRAYEARHYPPTRRLDVQGEGPETARERVLRWVQSRAHEQPGTDLLVVVERGTRRHGKKSAVRAAVEALLAELTGGLIEWWQPFAEGSLAIRVAQTPRRFGEPERPAAPAGEGRTDETAGKAWLSPRKDIPEEHLPLAWRAAELRRTREGLAVAAMDVVLQRVWIEAQAVAMTERVPWDDALRRVIAEEERRTLAELDED